MKRWIVSCPNISLSFIQGLEITLKSVVLLVALLSSSLSLTAQWTNDPVRGTILEEGDVVVTCGVQQATDPVVGIFDVKTPTFANNSYNLNAGNYPIWNRPAEIHPAAWSFSSLGNVFGATIDRDRYIYVTASSMFPPTLYLRTTSSSALPTYVSFQSGVGALAGGNAVAGAGYVYKLDRTTGAASVFAQLPQQSTTLNYQTFIGATNISLGTRTGGPGLGNIAYDDWHNQFFVTNFEDGKIYRLSSAGATLSTFDYGTADNGAAGMPALGDRTWAVAVHNGRLYYSVWTDVLCSTGDCYPGSTTYYPQSTNIKPSIRSVAINPTTGNFVPGSDMLEWNGAQLQFTMPISDIAFDVDGRMLIAQKAVLRQYVGYNHRSQTALLTGSSGSWTADVFLTGMPYTQIANPYGTEAYGGIDFGYNGATPDLTAWYSSADMVVPAVQNGINSSQGPHGIAGTLISSLSGDDTPDPRAIIPYAPGATGPNSLDAKGTGGDVDVVDDCMSIGNLVWLDADDNGLLNGTEAGMPGVTVRLLAPNGTVMATTVTNSSGQYLFSGLFAGEYFVEIVTPTGFQSSTGSLFAGNTGPYETAPDPDANPTNSDDNGTTNGITILSAPITLRETTESVADGALTGLTDVTDNNNANYTVDFGLRPICVFPIATFSPTAASCTGSTPNNNGSITFLTVSNVTNFGVSTINAGVYNGPAYPATTFTAIGQSVISSVPNTGGTYIIRVFNGNAACFTDVTVNVAATPCMAPCPTITNPSAAQVYCDYAAGNNITVQTNQNFSNSIRFVRFATDQMSGVSPTALEANTIYSFGTTIAIVTPTGMGSPYTAALTTVAANWAGLAPGTYYLYAVLSPDPGATCRPVQEIVVTILDLPTVSATPAVICSGSSIDLSTLITYTPPAATVSYHTTAANANTGASPLGSSMVTPTSTTPYYVRVQTSSGATVCFSTTSVVVTVTSLPHISIVSANVLCNGGSTGSATATIAGGTTPYTYDWSNDGPEVPDNDFDNITGAPIGTYTLTVTDAAGCTAVSTPVSITEPPVLAASASLMNPGGCPPFGSNGIIDLSVSGGTIGTGYTYDWAGYGTGNDPEDLSGLSAGTYTVTVTDANACTVSTSLMLSVTASAVAADIVVQPYGGCNATLNTIVTGGIGAITYDWSHLPGLNNQQNPVVNSAGTYTVTVTDASGCSITATATFAGCDLGDLPDTGPGTSINNYATLLSDNGPNHTIVPGFYIGSTIDAENDGLSTPGATGDGTDDNEIGLYPLTAGTINFIPVSYAVPVGPDATIGFMLDFNDDGDFNDSGEIFSTVVPGGTSGSYVFQITVPSVVAAIDGVGVRIRISTDPAAGTTAEGALPDGEVEDYLLQLICHLAITVNNGFTCAGTNIDLSTLVQDADGGALTFYTTMSDALSGTGALPSGIVAPMAATNYYVRSANSLGCFDVKKIIVSMAPTNCQTIQVSGPN